MAYQTGDNILDDHYNDFATSVNALWGTGTGDRGYGETTTVTSVSVGDNVTATQWTTLLNRISSMASHQGTSITTITNPSTGDLIEAYSALSGNIQSIDDDRLNVATRQTAVSANVDLATSLTGTITQERKFAWGSADQARYFFNAGGRLTCSWNLSGHTSDSKANNWASLATACGTYIINAQTSGKSGGSGTTNTNLTDRGYHDMNATATTTFKQFEDSSPYTASFIDLTSRTEDSGASVELVSRWVDAAADQTSYNKNIYNVQDQVDGTKRTTFAYQKHDTTYVADNGGTITVTTPTNTHSSDIRLKTNVETLGVVEGLQTYSWNYIAGTGIEGTYTGVMAQDLLGTQYENALSYDEMGYYQVNYDMLPVDCVKQ